MAECQEILNKKKRTRRRNRNRGNGTFHFSLPLIHSRALIQFIKQSPEHFAKLEDEMKDVALITVKPNSIAVKSLSPQCQNVEQWKRRCTNILKAFFKEYSAQEQRVNSFSPKDHKDGHVNIKILRSATDGVDVLVVGVAKDVAKKVYELKETSQAGMTHRKDLTVPGWLFKHLNQKVSKGRRKWPKVRLDYRFNENLIKFYGDNDQVEHFHQYICEEAMELQSVYSCKGVNVPKEFHKCVIGKQGSKINELRTKYQVEIDVPRSTSGSDEITIEGKIEDVSAAERDINNLVERLLKLPTSVFVPIDDRYLVSVIGYNGKFLQQMIKDFKVNMSCSVDPTKIRIYGNLDDVRNAETHIKNILDNQTDFVVMEVSIQNQKIGLLIGRNGSNINALIQKFKGVIEIITPEKNDLLGSTFLTGAKGAVDLLFEELQSTYSATKVGYVTTLMPKWINVGKFYQSSETQSTSDTISFTPSQANSNYTESDQGEIFFEESYTENDDCDSEENSFEESESSQNDDSGENENESFDEAEVADDESYASDDSLYDVPFTVTWNGCEKDLITFVRNSAFHTTQLHKVVNNVGFGIHDSRIYINTNDVVIEGFFSDLHAKSEEKLAQSALELALQNFFLNLPGKKQTVYTWQYNGDISNKNVLKFVKNSRKHNEKLQMHLCKVGSVSMSDYYYEVRVKSEILEVEKKEWQSKCKELLREFFADYTSIEVSFQSNVLIERKDVVESDVEVTWSGDKIRAIVCGLKTAAEKKVADLKKSQSWPQQKQTVNLNWCNIDNYVLEFVRISTIQSERLEEAMKSLGKVVIYDTHVSITGEVTQLDEPSWKCDCNQTLQSFFSNYQAQEVRISPTSRMQRKDVTEATYMIRWTEDGTCAIVFGIKSVIPLKVADLLITMKNKINAVYRWQCGNKFVFEFVRQSPVHTRKLLTELAHLGSISYLKNEIEIECKVLEDKEKEWNKQCKQDLRHFFSNYMTREVTCHPNLSALIKDMSGADICVNWSGNKTKLTVCGLKTAVEKKVAEVEKLKTGKKTVYFDWRFEDNDVLDFIKSSGTQFHQLEKDMETMGHVAIRNNCVSVTGETFLVSESGWKKNCEVKLRSHFANYAKQNITFKPTSNVERVDVTETTFMIRWNEDKTCALVCGVYSAVKQKVASLLIAKEQKNAVHRWQCENSLVLQFVKQSRAHVNMMKAQLAHLGSLSVTENEVFINCVMFEAHENMWRTKCKEDLGHYFSEYDSCEVKFPPDLSVEKKNVSEMNVTVTWHSVDSKAVICGIKSDVEKKVQELERLKTQKKSMYQTCTNKKVVQFLKQSHAHSHMLQARLAHLGTISIPGNQIQVHDVLYEVHESIWRRRCKEDLDRFLSDYTSRKVVFHPDLSINRSNTSELNVTVTWKKTKKTLKAIVCGLKAEVARKAAELEKLKNMKKSVCFEHRCIHEDLLDFLKNSDVQIQELQKYMATMGRVAVSNSYVSVTGESTQMQESAWRDNCEEKLSDFLRNYSRQEVQFHALSTVDRTDITESNVRIRWTANKTCAIVCGENDAVQAKVDVLSKAKNKKKSVCYKWECDEASLLSFVKESSQQLKELQGVFKDLGSPVISHENIVINGEILETSPRREWEMKCEDAIKNHFKKYSVVNIEVPPMALKKANRLSENRQDVITKWMEDCNSLTVFGLSYAVQLKVKSLNDSIAKFQKEEEDRLKNEGSFSGKQDGAHNNTPFDTDALTKCKLILTDVKARCLHAYKEAKAKEFLSVVLEDVYHGISIIGKKSDVEEAKLFAESIDVDELTIQKYGAYQFLTDSELDIEIIGIKNSCMLLVESVQSSDDSTFKYLSEDDDFSNASTNIVYGNLKVDVKEGDIAEEKVGAIVITTDSSFTYGGPLATSVLSKAGYDILSNCIPVDRDIHVSSGGNLPCNRIFHVAIPSLYESMDDLITRILSVAESHRLEGITIPTIGAGGGGWTSDNVAKGIHEGILKFIQSNENKFLKRVTVMLYPTMPHKHKQPFYKVLKSSGDDGRNQTSRSASPKKRRGLLSRLFGYFNSSSSTSSAPKFQSQSQPSFTRQPAPETDVDTKDSNVDSDSARADEKNAGEKNESSSPNSWARILIASKEKENVEKAKEASNKLINRHLKEYDVIDPQISRLQQTQVDAIKQLSTTNNVRIVIDCRKDKHSINIQGKHEDASTTKDEVKRILSSFKTIFPNSWEAMGKDDKLKRILLTKGSKEYSEVEDLFLKANGGGYYFSVKSIERIQNPGLYKQYQSRKDEISSGVQNSTLERRLFHGTASDTVDHICSDGFDRGFAGTANAAMYGKGVYFSTLTSYSHAYAKPGQYNLRKMFLADVLTGDYCVGDGSMIAAPRNANTKNLYDSVVDSMYNPTIFVVFKDASVYPAYIITYSSTY